MEREQAGLLMAYLIARLSDFPVIVFSPSGEVLMQTRPAIALFGDHTQVDVTDHHCLKHYWHPELGAFTLYRQVLVDPVEHQVLLVFTADPGSASAAKLRLLAGRGD